MLKIAEMRGDVMGRAQAALFLGDIGELVRVLEEGGQAPLAYVAAATHGLEEEAARLREALGEEAALPPLPAPGTAALVLPPAPLLREDNWPLLSVPKGLFETLAERGAAAGAAAGTAAAGAAAGRSAAAAAAAGSGGGVAAAAAAAGGLGDLEGAGWGDDDDLLGGDGLGGSDGGDGDGAGEGGGWDVDDLELPEGLGADAAGAAAGFGGDGADGGAGLPYIAPAPGVPAAQRWLERRDALAAEHCAAGAFDSAMALLKRQLGAVDFEALRPHMLELYAASHATLPGLPVRGFSSATGCWCWRCCCR